jgi:MFS family permease
MMAASAMITSGYSVVAVPLSTEFQPSRMVLMLTMTIFMLVSGLLSPVAGMLMDRWSMRLFMGLGAGLIVAGFVALSFATSFVQVLVIYGLLLAPANVLIGPMAAAVLLSRWFVKRRGTALGMAIAGVSFGGFAYPPIAQALLDGNDWRDALRLLAAIVALTVVPAALLIVNRPADRGLHPDGAASDPDVRQGQGTAARLALWTLLTDRSFWILAAIFGIVMAGMTGMVTNLVPLAVDEGIDAGSAALLISIYSGSGFIAKLVFAAVADRLPPRYLILTAITGYAAGMTCVVGAEMGYWMIALGVALIGLFGGLMVPLQGFLVPRIFGQQVVGRVSGVLTFVVLIGLLVTPPIFGRIFDRTGNYDAAFLAFAALALGLVLLVPYLRTQPDREGVAPEGQAGIA